MPKKQKEKMTLKKFLVDFLFIFKKLKFAFIGFRKYFVLGVIFILLIEITNLVAQYFLKDIVDLLFQLRDDSVLQKVIYLVGGMAIAYLLAGVFRLINNIMIVRAEIRIEHNLSLFVFRRFLDLSLGYHESQNTGGKLSKLNTGLDNVRRIMDRLFWDFVPTLIKIATSFVFLLWLDYRIGLLFFVAIPFFIYFTLRMNQKVAPFRRQIRQGIERVYGKYGQALYNVRTVQAYVQEDRESFRARVGILEIIKVQFRYLQTKFLYDFWRSLVVSFGGVLVVSLGVYLAYRGQLSPGTLVLVLGVSTGCYYSLFDISRIFDDVMDAKVGVDRILAIVESKEAVPETVGAPKLKISGKIEFRNVDFDYGDGKVLKKINLVINPGEVVAFVGPSGGGKTTIAKLIYRYFDPIKGDILVDEHNLKDIDLKNYRRQLGVVNQDIEIFDDSIKSNISYGQPGASFALVKQAAKISNADEFIDGFKQKYKTMVGERGVKLSGGQRQRVGIARAIVIDPRILILDEATSSLDAGSEKKIQQAIHRVIKDRTTIIIAHRLSTVQNADRIFVLEHGRIVESGKHAQLLKTGGLYSKLVKLQVGGYLQE
jgi:ABC-type multidrug transport system fused ATPase/permease subunit